MDKIKLNNIEVYAYHGLTSEENQLGQKFQIDVVITTDFKIGLESDDINDSVNYQDIFDKVSTVFVNPTCKLIETAANRVAEALLETDKISDVQINVRKPSVPIKGICNSVEVEIFRSKKK